VSANSGSRPGVGLLVCGAVVVGLSAARIATGWAPGPGWLLFESASWAVGGVLGLWGWSRLRRAKAAYPELSWREFLHTELVAVAILVVAFAVFGAPPEMREGLMRSLREISDTIGIARGRP